MYEELGYFDPNAPAEMTAESNFSNAEKEKPPPIVVNGSTSNSNCSLEELSEFHLSPQDCSLATAAVPQLQMSNNNPPDNQFQSNNIHLLHHDPSLSAHNLPSYVPQSSNWDSGYQDFVNLGPNPKTPDLLSLLQLPRSSLPPSISSLQDIMMTSSYDPLFHLNFPMQQSVQANQHGGLLGIDDQIDANEGVNMMYGEEDSHGIFNTALNRKGRGSRKRKVFPTERERRVHFKDRFGELKDLIPNPTKSDRASIVGEAIDHIKEMLRTIDDLKLLVEKKRVMKQRNKRGRFIEEEGREDTDHENYKTQSEAEQCLMNKNNSLRCSWVRRKSKYTEVDVRIIDDEITIKLVQKKKINCLLFVSKVIDQLQLDLQHVAGAQIGEHHSFLFNSKICEGSCVYASGIADTVMEVVEKQYIDHPLPINNGGYNNDYNNGYNF